MDRQHIGLKLVMDALKIKAGLDSFINRLILQKSIYLAQAAGVNLGYYFNWYLRGPYCSSLANDAFMIKEESPTEFSGWKLDTSSMDKLTQILPLIESQHNEMPKDRWVELLGSVHFLVDRNQVPSEKPTEIKAMLEKYEKNYTEQEVEQALAGLKKHGLLR